MAAIEFPAGVGESWNGLRRVLNTPRTFWSDEIFPVSKKPPETGSKNCSIIASAMRLAKLK